MKKIVFIVNGFYPDYSTNGICIKKLVDLIKEENEIHIISQFSDWHSKEYEMFEGIHIHRVETREIIVRKWINKNRNKYTSPIMKKMLLLLNQGVRFYYWFKPLVQKYTIKKDLVRAYEDKLCSLKDIDVVYGVCFPMESLIAAAHYKTYNGKAKIGAVLFDKFSTNISQQKNKWNMMSKFKRHIKLELEIFNHMDDILATFDWKDYINKYHKEIKNVHYIEIPALKTFSDLEESLYEYCYLGMVDKNIRPVTETLKVLSLLSHKEVQFSFGVKGNLYQEVKSFCLNHEGFIFYGTLPLEKSYEIQRKCKGLISIGNTDVTQTPSKIFEYICTGKPIVHFFYDKHDRCIELLKRYGNSICIDLNHYDANDISKLETFISKSHMIDNSEIKNIFKEADPSFTVQLILKFIMA